MSELNRIKEHERETKRKLLRHKIESKMGNDVYSANLIYDLRKCDAKAIAAYEETIKLCAKRRNEISMALTRLKGHDYLEDLDDITESYKAKDAHMKPLLDKERAEDPIEENHTPSVEELEIQLQKLREE